MSSQGFKVLGRLHFRVAAFGAAEELLTLLLSLVRTETTPLVFLLLFLLMLIFTESQEHVLVFGGDIVLIAFLLTTGGVQFLGIELQYLLVELHVQ